MGNLKRKLELYEKIFQAFGPGVSRIVRSTNWPHLLHVSERHVQTLLKAMTAQGWIEWQASSGRSKKAQLTCLVEPIEACYQYAQTQADAGNIEQVFSTLSFNGRNAGAELQAFLSNTNPSAQNIAYIPFHRELEALHPQRVLRRTERFLVMQICQRLTSVQARSNSAAIWLIIGRLIKMQHSGTFRFVMVFTFITVEHSNLKT